MAGKKKTIRYVMKALGVGAHSIVDFLKEKGIEVAGRPTTKLSDEAFALIVQEMDKDGKLKALLEEENAKESQPELEKTAEAQVAAEKAQEQKTEAESSQKPETIVEEPVKEPEVKGLKVVDKIDLEDIQPKKKKKTAKKKEEPAEKPEAKQPVEEKPAEKPESESIEETDAKEEPEKVSPPEHIQTAVPEKPKLNLTGEKVDLSKIDNDTKPKKTAKVIKKKDKQQEEKKEKQRKRKRIKRPVTGKAAAKRRKEEPTEEEIKKTIKETLERLQSKGSKKKLKRERRAKIKDKLKKEQEAAEREEKTLRVSEFILLNELAGLMNVPATDLVTKAFTELGVMVTLNQRLDAEIIQLLADEYGYEVEFVDAEEVEKEEANQEEPDNPEDLVKRPPIVTIMGHVDHGKTSLLDYIRKTNVVAGEAGGITQHIGAYNITLDDGEKITFLDTPGHEAFTAMRARGAQITDVAVIIIAADDRVNQQTKEAISHAKAAGVPIVFAINKIDKPNANPEKIKTELSQEGILVEEWGGNYQSQEISAKTGEGVKELLEKILVEADLLELKANPNKPAKGTVVEAALDKGKGYTATVLVQDGTLRVGDYVVAGRHHGKVRAMYDERGNKIKEAGPSIPVKITGLDGAPHAGDKFQVYLDEKEAKKIAQRRDQIFREQQLRSRRHITLDEIGRRLALGDFKELNLIIKGDVDGSVEALSDALLKLSNEQVEVRILHKGVGAITEADVDLASASDAIIIGFNVRPSGNAARKAQEEGVQIKTYSVIYDVIDDVKNALENMLSPVEREEVTGTAEVRQTFKISKVGTVAGCMVTSGKIYNKSRIRVIRDGIVIHDGELASLKRFKDDVKEVAKGYECGLTLKNYNDIKEGDVLEAYTVKMERQKL